MGRNHHHLEAVDLLEFEGLGIGGTGHAGQLLVEAEIILEGDRRDGLVFLLDGHAFLRLDGLMQTVGPAATGHGAAGEFVDNDHLSVLHDVIHIALVDGMGTQGRVQMMNQRDIRRIVEALTFFQQTGLDQQPLGILVTFLGEESLLGLLIDGEVAGAVLFLDLDQLRHHLVHARIQLGAVCGRSGDNQGRARLVDEYGIDLVDDGEIQASLHPLLQREGQVVVHVVETELVVGAVGDVRCVGFALLVVVHGTEHHADAETKEIVQLAHPLTVALRQIVVDRDDMHALAGQRIEIGGQRGDQGLALAGAHLGDLVVVEDHASDQLNIVVAHAEHPARGLAAHGEGLGQHLLEGFALLVALLEFVGLGRQLLVGEGLHLRLQGIDLVDFLA